MAGCDGVLQIVVERGRVLLVGDSRRVDDVRDHLLDRLPRAPPADHLTPVAHQKLPEVPVGNNVRLL